MDDWFTGSGNRIAFNDILETKSGIESEKRFSKAKAEIRGKHKGKFKWFYLDLLHNKLILEAK